MANQCLQRPDVAAPRAGLAFARHDDADSVARQVVEALNGERIAGGNQQRRTSISGKDQRLGLDDRGLAEPCERCCTGHDDVGIERTGPAYLDGEVAEREAAAEQHPDDDGLRQRYDDNVFERQTGILRLRPGPGAERRNDLAAEQNREMIALGKNRQINRRAQPPDDIGNRIGVTVECRSIRRQCSEPLPDYCAAAPRDGSLGREPTAFARCG